MLPARTSKSEVHYQQHERGMQGLPEWRVVDIAPLACYLRLQQLPRRTALMVSPGAGTRTTLVRLPQYASEAYGGSRPSRPPECRLGLAPLEPSEQSSPYGSHATLG